MSLSLYAAIWLTSTAFALVARPLNLQPGADKTSIYREGFNAQNCPFRSPTVILTGSPARSEWLPRPASAPAVPKSAMTRRVPPAAEAQVCQQIAQLSFTGAVYSGSYDGRTLSVLTQSPLQPGLYALMVTGNKNIRGISVVGYYGGLPPPGPSMRDEIVQNNLSSSLGFTFRIERAAVLNFWVSLWTDDTVGQVVLFKLDPDGWRAANQRMGLHVSKRLRT